MNFDLNSDTGVDPTEEAPQEPLKEEVPQKELFENVSFMAKGVLPLAFMPFLIAGLFFQIVGLWTAILSTQATLTWKPVRAEVLASNATRVYLRSGSDLSLDVKYRYWYNGKPYESSEFGVAASSRFAGEPGANAKDPVRDYPKGGMFTAYVNPDDPSSAAVDPRPTFSNALAVLLAVPFTLVGLSGVLSDSALSRFNYEWMSFLWGVAALATFALGHGIDLAVGVVFAIYFTVLAILEWNSRIAAARPAESD